MLDGTLPPDRPLPGERLLAVRFAVSRGSIRDALRLLETIGLLETRHGQGTFPHELDVNRLVAPLASILAYRSDLREELLDVRRMFEPAVARVAAARVTVEDLADLQRILDTQRRKLKAGGMSGPIADGLRAQRDFALVQLDDLIRRGRQLSDALAVDSSDAASLTAALGWQQTCAAAIHQLSGGSKAHWLSRAFSSALLV